MTGHLIVTDEDATRVITLRRPEKKNAITQDMYRAMSEAIDSAQNNPDIRCIVIRRRRRPDRREPVPVGDVSRRAHHRIA